MRRIELPALRLFLGRNVVSVSAASLAGRKSTMLAIRKGFIEVKPGRDELEITPKGRQRLMALIEECETLIETPEIGKEPAAPTYIDVRLYDENDFCT